MQQAAEQGAVPDQVLICCGGGGLTAGSMLAIKAINEATAVYPVEPIDFDDTARSLISGQRESIDRDARSICDALQTTSPGKLTFEIIKDRVEPVVLVTDDEVRDAMRFAFQHLKLVVEPGGAVALAAVLQGKVETAGRVTVAVLSGGNVDAKMFAEIQAA
jgi:threonine dehydratase